MCEEGSFVSPPSRSEVSGWELQAGEVMVKIPLNRTQ